MISNKIEDVFLEGFLSIEGETLTNSPFDLILELAQSLSTVSRSNIDFMLLYLKLLKRADTPLQIENSLKLWQTIQASPNITQYGIFKDWLTSLLLSISQFSNKTVLEHLLLLVKLFASHHIAVHHVKLLFTLFQCEEGHFKDFYWRHSFKMISGLWSTKSGPGSYFEHAGDCSGVMLPSTFRLPSNGYTFFTWIRFTDFSNPFDVTGVGFYKPYILSFCTESGLGVHCFVQSRNIVFTHTEHFKVTGSKAIAAKLSTKQWYFIGFTHKPGFLLGKSMVSFYLNGKLVESFPLSFPGRGEQAMSLSRIGISSECPENVSHSFRGHMAGYCMLDESINEELMNACYEEGPQLFASQVLIDRVLMKQSGGFLKTTRTKIHFFYSPMATDGSQLIETASKEKDLRASKFGSVVERHTVTMAQAFFCVGGITVILPFFSAEFRPQNLDSIDMNMQLFHLVTHMVKGNKYYQDEMRRSYFFPVMGYLLSCVSNSTWSKEAVETLLGLSRVITSKTLYKQLYLHIFLNFEIWTNAPFDVQEQLLTYISEYAVAKEGQNMKALFTVEKLVEIVDKYYSVSVSTKKRAVFLTPIQQKKCRFLLLSVIRSIIQQGVKVEDLKYILLYLQREARKPVGDQYCVDFIQLLLSLLHQKVDGIAAALDELGGINIFSSLLTKENDKLFIWVLKLIGLLLLGNHPDSVSEEKLKAFLSLKKYLEHVRFTKNIYCALLEILVGEISVKEVDNLVSVYQNKPHSQQSSSNTNAASSTSSTAQLKAMGHGLTGLLTGDKSEKANEGERLVPLLKVPGVLRMMFAMMTITDDKALNLLILNNLLFLLSNSANRRFFLRETLWEDGLLSLIAKEDKGHYHYAQGDKDEETLDGAVLAIFGVLLKHSLTVKDGHTTFLRLRELLHHYGRMAFLNSHKLGRIIFMQVMVQHLSFYTLEAQKQLLVKSLHPAIWKSVTEWLFVIEELLFENKKSDSPSTANSTPTISTSSPPTNNPSSPTSASSSTKDLSSLTGKTTFEYRVLDIHRSSTGVWTDLMFAYKLLDFLGKMLQMTKSVDFDVLTKRVDRLRKFYLRLALYVLTEATIYQNLFKNSGLTLPAQSLKQLFHQNVVDRSQSKTITLAVERYIEGKAKQVGVIDNTDISHAMALSMNVLTNLVCELDLCALVYIIPFLHFALESKSLHPKAKSDLGTLMLQTVILVQQTYVSVESNMNAFHATSPQDLCAYFMKLLSHNDPSNWTEGIGAFFSASLATYHKLETSYFKQKREKLDAGADHYCQISEQVMMQELETQQVIHQKFNKHWDSFIIQSEIQYSNSEIRNTQLLNHLESLWKRLLRQMINSKGPWSRTTKEKQYWKLSNIETNNRMRLKLTRSYGDHLAIEKAMQQKAAAQVSPRPKGNDLEGLMRIKFKQPVGEKDTVENSIEAEFEEIFVEPVNPLVGKGKEEEREIFLALAQWVKGINITNGDFELSSLNIYFRNMEENKFKTIAISSIKKIYRRKYMFTPRAIEIFTSDKKSYFFVFDKFDLEKVIKELLKRATVEDYTDKDPIKLLKKRGITDMWRRRQISNFDYLMELNTVAGRTYNDLSQYPVFPWVIADYISDELDLTSEKTFRDFSKPVGAQNANTLKKVIERYELMQSDMEGTPAFHYGSHYSSPAVVLYYLVRLEPFTSYFLKLQDGKFDHAQRMFWSIPVTWQNCLENMSDVKELIPEFFTTPTFLANINKVNFHSSGLAGGNQSSIDDVLLPPWAQGSPEVFIEMNRRALESDYVSSHLQEWIDLVFGYKQRGPQAIAAHNVFYHLTYEGAVDVNSIPDARERLSVTDQIRNFGQTPSQLFTQPHDTILSKEEARKEMMSVTDVISDGFMSMIGTAQNQLAKGGLKTSLTQLNLSASGLNTSANVKEEAVSKDPGTFVDQFVDLALRDVPIPIVKIVCAKDKLILFYADGLVSRFNCKAFTKAEPERVVLGGSEKEKDIKLNFIFSHYVPLVQYSNNFAVTCDMQSYISGAHWDNSFQLHSSYGDVLGTIFEHRGNVTAVALNENSTILATGSVDCNCLIWNMKSLFVEKKQVFDDTKAPKPLAILYGQDTAIRTIDINDNLDLIATGASRQCILYNLHDYSYLRTLQYPAPLRFLKILNNGHIVAYVESSTFNEIHIDTINGVKLKSFVTNSLIQCFTVSDSGDYLVLGGDNGTITAYYTSNLSFRMVMEWKCGKKVSSLAYLPEYKDSAPCLLVGTEGQCRVIRFDEKELTRARLHRNALNSNRSRLLKQDSVNSSQAPKFAAGLTVPLFAPNSPNSASLPANLSNSSQSPNSASNTQQQQQNIPTREQASLSLPLPVNPALQTNLNSNTNSNSSPTLLAAQAKLSPPTSPRGTSWSPLPPSKPANARRGPTLRRNESDVSVSGAQAENSEKASIAAMTTTTTTTQPQQQSLSSEFNLNMKDGSVVPFAIVDTPSSDNQSNVNSSNSSFSNFSVLSNPLNPNNNVSSNVSASNTFQQQSSSTETSPSKVSTYPVPSFPTLQVQPQSVVFQPPPTMQSSATTHPQPQATTHFPHPHLIDRLPSNSSLLLDNPSSTNNTETPTNSRPGTLDERDAEMRRLLSSNPKPLPSVPKPATGNPATGSILKQPVLIQHQPAQPNNQQHLLLQQMPSVPNADQPPPLLLPNNPNNPFTQAALNANAANNSNAVKEILERREERRMGMSHASTSQASTSADWKQLQAQLNNLSEKK